MKTSVLAGDSKLPGPWALASKIARTLAPPLPLHNSIYCKINKIMNKKKLNRKDYMFDSLSGQTLTKAPGEVDGQQFVVANLRGCTVFLCDYVEQVALLQGLRRRLRGLPRARRRGADVRLCARLQRCFFC